MNPAQLTTLANEIANDPLGRGYDGMSDIAVADSINTSNRPAFKPVDVTAIRRYLLLNGLMPGIKDAKVNGATAQIKKVADTIIDTLNPNAFEQISLEDPTVFTAVSNMIDVMVAAGVVTSTDKTNILSLRNTTRTRAAELDIPAPTHLDVAYARGAR